MIPLSLFSRFLALIILSDCFGRRRRRRSRRGNRRNRLSHLGCRRSRRRR